MNDFIKTDVQSPQTGEIKTWIEKQLIKYGEYLLAFADDGVIWGKLVDNKLVTSHDIDLLIFPNNKNKWVAPELREKTLQQAFVFGKGSEVRLFKDELGKWKALRVVDGNNPQQVIIESQILWGDRSEGQPQNGFLRFCEYRSGIPDQYLPIDKSFGDGECARLEVHHLVEFDKDTGEARIALSRLVGLRVGKRNEEVKYAA